MFRAIVFQAMIASCFVSGASAEDERTLHYDEQLFHPQRGHNAFFVDYGIIDNHPSCNGRGNVAFEVNAELSNLNFHIVDAKSQAILLPTLLHEEEKKPCFRTIRRGGEVELQEVLCEEEDRSDEPLKTDAERDLATKLDMTVAARICIAPDRNTALGGEWSAAFSQSSSDFTLTGVFPPDVQDAVNESGVRTTTKYSSYSSDDDFKPMSPDRGTLIERGRKSVGLLLVELECLPVTFDNLNGTGSFIAVPLWLIIDRDTPNYCTGSGCPASFDQWGPTARTVDCG